MVNGIRIICRRVLNKGFGSKFPVDSRVRYETPEEGHRLKHCEYSNKNEVNSLNNKD